MTSEDRKKAAKEARLKMRAATKESAPRMVFYGGLNDWRHINGGVKILEDDEDEQTVAEQEAMLDELYQQVLARKLQKVAEENKKEVQEFAEAIKRVKGQISLMKQKEARMRRRARVKHPNGVLLSGDIIEKTVTSYVPEQVRAQEEKAVATRMASVVTVKIEAGESVQVQIKNTDMTRTEHGPQVLILASTEQLIASTFPLTKRNVSYKPEFTWTLTPSYTNAVSGDPSLSSSSRHGFSDPHSPSHSFSHSFSHSHSPSPSSYSFHDSSFTPSYSLPDDYSFSPSFSSSFSFHDSPATHTYDFVDDSIGRPAYSFDAQVVSESGNIYSFQGDDEEFAYQQNGNAFSFGDEYGGEEVEEKIPEVRLQELTDLAAEVTRVKGVHSEGFMSEADFKRAMEELSQKIGWLGNNEDLESELQTMIDGVQKEIEQKKEIVPKIESDEEIGEPGAPPKESKRQQQRTAKAAQRGRGAANGAPNRGRGGLPNRGGGPPNRGRGGLPNRGGGPPNRRAVPNMDAPPPTRGGGFRGRGGPPRGRGGPRRVGARGDDADNFSDVSSVISNMSDYYAPEPSEFEKKISMCDELLEYLHRYLPKDAKNGKFAKLGNGTFQNGESKNGKDEYDYLSSSHFLTDEEEGYYYEKEQERRKQKKKKTKKAKKTLYHSTRIFTFFGLIETFPPTTLEDVPDSIKYVEEYRISAIRLEELKRFNMEESRKYELAKAEREKEQESASIYSAPASSSAPTFSLAPEGSASHDAESHHDDVGSEFSELRQEIDDTTNDAAMGEEGGDLDGDLADLF